MKLDSVLMVLVQCSIVFVKVLGHFLSDHLDIKFSRGYIRCKDTNETLISLFFFMNYERIFEAPCISDHPLLF